MAQWTPFPHDGSVFAYDGDTLQRLWPRLHAGDAEPWPANPAVQAAWRHFHAGDFRAATEAGLQAGRDGITVANKAQAVYACYLEPRETTRLALLQDVAERARAHTAVAPDNPNAHFLLAYALGRHSQGVSVTRALAQGLGAELRQALGTCLQLQPRHADAYTALGTFHAEVIDKVGGLLGHAQGADRDAGLAMLRTALQIHPASVIGKVEYARGLVLLGGEQKLDEANALFHAAAAHVPVDATERLVVDMARAELDDDTPPTD